MPTEIIHFRVMEMPCCKHLLCWVNPRLPTHCPECGALIYVRLRSGEYHRLEDRAARITYQEGKVELTKGTPNEE